MAELDWADQARRELAQAREARLAGKEGMARVCARRAAGIIAGEYLRRTGFETTEPSATYRLRMLAGLPAVEPEVRRVADHFLVKVTRDHTLPVEADLVAEAGWLAERLLQVEL